MGAAVTLDLRLLGAFAAHPLAHLGPPLSRVAATGLALAVATGLLLFSTRPVTYVANPAFLAKLGLVAIGTANALALRAGGGWARALDGAAVPAALRLGATLSLLAWLGALLAGRAIGFVE